MLAAVLEVGTSCLASSTVNVGAQLLTSTTLDLRRRVRRKGCDSFAVLTRVSTVWATLKILLSDILVDQILGL